MNEIWNEVFEQQKAKDILTKIYESRRVPHAFLFSGKEGVGKFYTALQFAKLLNSQISSDRIDTILKKISNYQEPYIKLVFPLPRGKGETGDDSSTEKLSKDVLENLTQEIQKKILNPYHKIEIEDANNIKINSIREIKKILNVSHDEIFYRFIILLDAHLMNEQAQNALLKSLEEPPKGVIFILITSESEKLLPTIQSRCWRVDFDPLSISAVENILVRYFSIDKQIAKKVSLFSEGTPLFANELNNSEFKEILAKTISILRYSLGRKYNSAYRELNSVIRDSSNNSIKFLSKMIKTWLDDVVKNKHEFIDYYFEDYVETMEKFNNRYTKAEIFKIFNILDKLEGYQDKNINLNIICLSLIFEIASISIRN